MIDQKYLIYHDLIGINAYARPIHKVNNKKFVNIGVVINETKNMLITELDNKIKKYIKKDYIFRLKLPTYKNDIEEYYLEVQGNKIVGLPVNRLRSLKKKRWMKK
jgi:RNase P/RNase MRP subunit p29